MMSWVERVEMKGWILNLAVKKPAKQLKVTQKVIDNRSAMTALAPSGMLLKSQGPMPKT